MSWETEEHPHLNEILQAAANHFGLGAITHAQRIGGNANHNYLVDTDRGAFIMKIILEHPLEDLQTEAVYLTRLREHGFPAAYYVTAPDGEFVFKHDGYLVAVLLQLAGDHPQPTQQVCRSVGRHLARLHLLPFHGLPERNHWLRPAYLPEAISLARPHFPDHAERLAQELQSLAGFRYSDLPQAIIHGDMTPSNCLFQGDHLSAFLDWEEMGIAPAVLDLATGVLNFCFQDNLLQTTSYEALLKGYQAVRPLTTGEMDALPLALRYAGLTLSVWRLLQFGLYHPDNDKLNEYNERDRDRLRLRRLPLGAP